MKKKVAIVEDSELVSNLYQQFFNKRFNFEVSLFSSAEDFMKQGSFPDLLLLDYFLDKGDPYAMTGLELLEELKTSHRDMPVLVVSGLRNPHIKKQLRDYKIISFMDKDSPQFWNELENQITNYFNGR